MLVRPLAGAVQSYQTSAARSPQFEGPSVLAPLLSPKNGPLPEIAVAVAQVSLPPLTKLLWLGPSVRTGGFTTGAGATELVSLEGFAAWGIGVLVCWAAGACFALDGTDDVRSW